jgi:hypothetical protein
LNAQWVGKDFLWSPDGKAIYSVQGDANGKSGLFRITTGGERELIVRMKKWDSGPRTISPNGSHVVVCNFPNDWNTPRDCELINVIARKTRSFQSRNDLFTWTPANQLVFDNSIMDMGNGALMGLPQSLYIDYNNLLVDFGPNTVQVFVSCLP